MRTILERQGYHALALAFLLSLTVLSFRAAGLDEGFSLGIPTPKWFAWCLAIAILHQVYVLVTWRLELHHQTLSRALGDRAFAVYGVFFILLLVARAVLLVPLALADRGSAPLPVPVRAGLALVAGGLSLYVLYSVARFFSFRRAMGADHFDGAFRGGELEKRGIFQYVRNAMYTLGLLALWLPGILWGSTAALLAAAFQHAYIWVHYYTVEKPDMLQIYGAETAG